MTAVKSDQRSSRDEKQQGSQRAGSGSRNSLAKNKHIIEEFINVGVPHRVAYDQWTQYGEWSKIFKKESAKKESSGDNKITVLAKIGPSQRQWQTEVVSQNPGRRIEWRAKGGVQAEGVVTFHRLADRLTHLQVVIHYQPSGFMETVGNFFRMQRRRVRKDLKLFKNFVELKGEATGKGPGRVEGGGVKESIDQELGGQGDGGQGDRGQSRRDRGRE